jgi:hypothetical protein
VSYRGRLQAPSSLDHQYLFDIYVPFIAVLLSEAQPNRCNFHFWMLLLQNYLT